MRAFVIAILVSAAGAASAPVRPVAAVVLKVKGKARMDGKLLKENAFLYSGSVVETGAGGCVAAALVTGAEVRFNENSEGRVEGSTVSLRTGQIWARVIHGKTGIKIQGPAAEVAVRGATADVAVGSRTVVKVYEGSVEISEEGGKRSLSAADFPAKDRGTWQTRCAGR